jgi:hypothetical protein
MTDPFDTNLDPDDQESSTEADDIGDDFEPVAAVEPPLAEDDPGLLDTAVRRLDAVEAVAEPPGLAPTDLPVAAMADEISDAAAIGEDEFAGPVAAEPAAGRLTPVQVLELSSHRIGLELKRIESQIRALLEDRDPKRKRKLSGTARWHELEEDLIALRYSGRVDEGTLAQVRQLIARRHHLFAQLRFQSATRPTWNS